MMPKYTNFHPISVFFKTLNFFVLELCNLSDFSIICFFPKFMMT